MSGSTQCWGAPGQIVAWGTIGNVPTSAIEVKAVAAGGGFGLALRNDGTVFAWGYNSFGQATVPPGLTGVTGIACGPAHSLALRANGTVVGWGYNYNGQADVPAGLTNVIAIAAGYRHSLALRDDGSVVAWGDDEYGQTDVPTDLTNAMAIACGSVHNLALRRDGAVVAWGFGYQGQTNVPFGLSNVAGIAAGGWNSLALRSNGTLVGWGNNAQGQTNIPAGLTNIAAIAVGSEHSLALRSNGTVVAWGDNSQGAVNVPSGLKEVAAIAAGDTYSLARLRYWTPIIEVHPLSQTVYTGHACIMSVAASSGGPLAYQWQVEGNDIPHATNSQLVLSQVKLNDAGNYLVVVSNPLGAATSQPAYLRVIESGPTITLQPIDQPIYPGESLLLQVGAYGPAPLDYQWRFNAVAIPGATNFSLHFSNANTTNRGVYTVVVHNPSGSVTSNPAFVFVPNEHRFSAPDGPLIWDFSGAYPSPVGNLQQRSTGVVVNDLGAAGNVHGNGSSVGFSLNHSDPAGYWIYYSSTHKAQVLQDGCAIDLTLSPTERRLSGANTCVFVEQEYELFLFSWAPYRNLTTHRSSTDFSTALPTGIDGQWKLALNVVPSGDSLVGRAVITLSGTNVVWFDVTGTNSTATKTVMTLQGPPNELIVATTGPEMSLQSAHGTVAGQSVHYDAPAHATPLTVIVNGDGAVALPGNSSTLLSGEDYDLTPVPLPGNLFSNWNVGGIWINDIPLRFTMVSNLTITANFVTNPFTALKGSYSGLFHETNIATHLSAGCFTLMLTDRGTFSGKLQQGAMKHPFSGQFDLALATRKNLPRKGAPEVVLQLQLAANSDRVTGQVSNLTWNSELFGYRADFNRRSNPATNFAGKHTFALPGADHSDRGPTGQSCGQLEVNTDGSVLLKGTMADGNAAVQKAPLAGNGQWPLYVPLYSGRGSVFGWLTMVSMPTNDVHGLVLWTKPGGVKGPLHPAGFTNEMQTLGSRYTAPVSGAGVLDPTNVMVALEGGNLSDLLTYAATLKPNHPFTIVPPNAESLSLIVRRSSGSLEGSFIHPLNGKRSKLKGVVLQKQKIGAGFFLGTNESGRLSLSELE